MDRNNGSYKLKSDTFLVERMKIAYKIYFALIKLSFCKSCVIGGRWELCSLNVSVRLKGDGRKGQVTTEKSPLLRPLCTCSLNASSSYRALGWTPSRPQIHSRFSVICIRRNAV